MANTNIELVGLDFQSIKSNLKNYLKNNTAFKDVDFEGSNISVLVDLLSYNTYLNSFYMNMVSSEMFLDSSQLRDSVVSHAKSLNYLPRSFVSAKADISISITPSSVQSSVVIPKGTTFTSRVGSNTFSFCTDTNIVLNESNNNIFSTNLAIYEGSYITDTFVMNYSNVSQRFIMSNPTIDTTSLFVTVIEDNGDTSTEFIKTETLVGIGTTSNVYFIEAAENQQYELKFGDDIFGRKPKDGSVIISQYRYSSGELPNGASRFLNDGSIDGHSNVSISTINNASGGAINESIESIRFNAPRNFQSQSRAVTTSDYENLLKSKFPEIENISAYGGETLVPPQFGKVFISVDIINADGTPENRKKTYYDYIKDKSPVSIEPVFIDPVFMYVSINSTVKYNINVTTKLSNDIKTLVLSKISSFNLTNLNGFNKTLFYSKLLKEIDSSDTSIVSNDTIIKAIKTITPTSSATSYEINFGFPLEQETGVTLNVDEFHYGHAVQSSAFTFGGQRCMIIDDTRGTLYIGKITSNVVEIKQQTGTVDYENGIVYLQSFSVSDFEGSGLKIYVRSKSKDFYSNKNTILEILDEDVIVNVTPVKV